MAKALLKRTLSYFCKNAKARKRFMQLLQSMEQQSDTQKQDVYKFLQSLQNLNDESPKSLKSRLIRDTSEYIISDTIIHDIHGGNVANCKVLEDTGALNANFADLNFIEKFPELNMLRKPCRTTITD